MHKTSLHLALATLLAATSLLVSARVAPALTPADQEPTVVVSRHSTDDITLHARRGRGSDSGSSSSGQGRRGSSTDDAGDVTEHARRGRGSDDGSGSGRRGRGSDDGANHT
ncbi:hypothetical protein [Sphaerotilus sp.]|uniref:hypothetical protein n=1 Tax=Sphaerotilus sp. TaxID=2093942 RepID=UPI002ACECA6E|nr:hypothetical protein [Sphaerotilus sp.]MDZ7854901.1 hypothetical protein [Sphaerotilus sp.]